MRKVILTSLALLSFLSVFGEDGRSFKRGFGENKLYYVEDLQALKQGTTWYYDWGAEPSSQVADYVGSDKGIEFIPMAWNGGYNVDLLRAYYTAHPSDRYLLGFNEPNFPDQAAMLPSEAAEKWHELEALAKELNLILVAPAMNYAASPLKDGKTWDPYEWMDAFIAAYKEKYGTEPHYDYTAVHAYMRDGNATMSLVNGFAEKYGKKVWLTEFCQWESNTTAATQMSSMIDKVKQLELSDNVYRYAWFKAREANKWPYYALVYYPTKTIAKGTLTDLGFAYLHMSTFDKTKYYGVNEAIPSNAFIDCNLTNIRKSADPRALDNTELYLNENYLSATYQVDVPEAGNYKLVVRYAREKDNLTARINVVDKDGNKLVSRLAMDPTEGWTNYVAKAIDVTLPAGKQTIKIEKANFAPLALSLVKLVKTVDENDPDMKTMTGEDIDKPDPDNPDTPDTPDTLGENESFDKEVVVSDDAFTWNDNDKYYAIFLDATTRKAHISDDRFLNIGTNAVSQFEYPWEDSFSYGEATGKNSFGVEGEYKVLVTSNKGWSGFGYNVDASKGDLDLSHINKDYKLHLALKATHNRPIDFYIYDGSGHVAHLVFGQYNLDGRDPVANFKRDGKWHNIDIPMTYLTKKYGIDFSKDTDFNGNLLCINAGAKEGVQVCYDAVFFYGPKDSQPDTNTQEELSRTSVTVSDTPFQFSDDERYYVITLDAMTKAKNLSESQIIDCGPNGTSHQLYPWEGTCTANSTTGVNSFGESEPYMSWTQTDKGWFGLGYNVAASNTPLNLSDISNDYYLHFAVKSTYTGSILFSLSDVAGTNGNIVLGKEAYHNHAPLADFERDGKWHNVEVPVHLITMNDGLNYTRSTNYTGNIFCVQMGGKEGSTVDYDAVFFHGPKSAPAYATEKVDNKNFTITKAADKPFQFSKDETYYIVTLDASTKKENLTDDQIVDIGPNESTRFLYPWGDTVKDASAIGENSFGVEGAYAAWETQPDKGWSGLGFYIDANGLTSLAGINKDYSLHFAIKSSTTQPIDIIIADGNKKECHFVLGNDKYGDNSPMGNFERDNTWHNVDIPMAYLIRKGLDFRTAKAYDGNIFSVMLGTTGGLRCDYDAVFFHGPKDKSTGIDNAIADENRPHVFEGTEIYDLQGRKVQSMTTPGTYIVRSAAGVRKVLKR